MDNRAIVISDEILFYIFTHHLDFESKLRAEKVCHRWREVMNLSFANRRSLIVSDFEVSDNRIKHMNLDNKKYEIR